MLTSSADCLGDEIVVELSTLSKLISVSINSVVTLGERSLKNNFFVFQLGKVDFVAV
jgi:hypothetical protein